MFFYYSAFLLKDRGGEDSGDFNLKENKKKILLLIYFLRDFIYEPDILSINRLTAVVLVFAIIYKSTLSDNVFFYLLINDDQEQ